MVQKFMVQKEEFHLIFLKEKLIDVKKKIKVFC